MNSFCHILSGVFEGLCNLPTDWQFDIAVNAHVDDYRTLFDGKRFVDLAEIVGPVDSKAFGAEADGQFFEIRLCDFRIFRREVLVDEIMPFLSYCVVVEDENGERQIVADGGMEIGHVHHERGISGEMGNSFARSRKAGAECNG